MDDLVQKYLNDLDIGPSSKIYDQVNQIIQKHLTKMTFNNLYVLLNKGTTLSLDIDDLFEKIVDQKKGGYCFEQNKLLFHMLTEMGLKTRPQLARVLFNKKEDVPRDHRLTLVTIEGQEYLADVGFGPLTPSMLIPVNGSDTTCSNGNIYRVVEIAKDEFHLELLKEDGYFVLYSFDRGSYADSDFKVANYYTNHHPESKFTRELVVSRILPSETFLLYQQTFSRIAGKQKAEIMITSANQLKSIVSDHFFVNLNDEESEVLFATTQNQL